MENLVTEPPKETSDDVSLQNNEEATAPATSTSSKNGGKKSKKEDKNIDHFMKSLNSMASMEEKLAFVCKKFVQVSDENKKLHFFVKQAEKTHTQLGKEKDHLQHEYNVTVLVKSKLENLCRELQKQNKAIKEESLLKLREEDERRKETQAKFQSTLSEITALLQQNSDMNAKLRDDNVSMTDKFNSVLQQYQLREQQVDKMAKQMALESQLSDAKILKANLEHQAEKEVLVADTEKLKILINQYRLKVKEYQETEKALKGQLAVYTDKYEEFQNALVKSNKVFTGFKEQMDIMSKKIKKLEAESLSWKNRYETSQAAVLELCAERQANETQMTASARQLQHMQSLCRTLQSERTALLNTLKEHNIERPPLPAPSAAPPPPPPASNAKMDAMVANCAQLRQSLAHLQSQLNVLTTAPNKLCTIEESTKQEKQKKNKSKKIKAVSQQVPATEALKNDEQVENNTESNVATTSTNEIQTTETLTKEKDSVPDDSNSAQVDGETDDLISTVIQNVDTNIAVVENGTSEETPLETLDSASVEKVLEAISNENKKQLLMQPLQ